MSNQPNEIEIHFIVLGADYVEDAMVHNIPAVGDTLYFPPGLTARAKRDKYLVDPGWSIPADVLEQSWRVIRVVHEYAGFFEDGSTHTVVEVRPEHGGDQ